MNPTPTVAEREKLLRMARAAKLERNWAALSPIERVDRGGRLALSPAQQRLWFLEQMGGMGGTYNVRRRLRLRGELDRAALGRALDRIVARHEALRTRFVAVDGEPEQRITPAEESGFQLVEHDLSGHADAGAALRGLVDEEGDAPFDLERGPLIRGRLVRVGEQDHVLLLTMHHIVSDAWSTGVLLGELGVLYGAYRSGGEDPLPPLPVQYADYAAWQRQWMDGEAIRRQADFWRKTLDGAPPLLELPTDHGRPERQGHGGAAVAVELGEELAAGLKALGQRHGTTLFMTLLAGWAVVLGRLSGQQDVVVGTPTANRERPEIEGLIGFFVNTLALRVDLAGSPTVAELLARVKERVVEAQHRQDIPFEQVVDLVQPSRSLAYSPVFQVMFAWQNAPWGTLALPGLELEPLEGGARSTVKFDLDLTLGEVGGRIAGWVEYATSLFERATVERYVGYLRRVLEGMAADDGRKVERLELLSGAERRQVVEEWSRTDGPYPAGTCIHELFEAQAERSPDAAAVVQDDRGLTYSELNARANRLAHGLRGLGVGPEARVAVCVERSPEMVVGLLAVLKAGGAYVPLDPSHPDDRLHQVLADSGPMVLLTQRRLAGRFADLDLPVLALDEAGSAWAGGPETNPGLAGLTPENLAYIIFTSGSTGRSKGVMIEHRSVCRQIAAISAELQLTPADRSLQFASVTFDASVEEIFATLLSGSTLVLRTDAWIQDAATFWARCEAHRVTVMDLPTRFWQLLATDPRPAIPARVRLVAVGGEAADPSAVAAWFRGGGHRPRLVNTYGPTECTVNATAGAWTEDPSTWSSIGRPVRNTRAYLLDPRGEPVPVGVAGEIHLGGGQVARGYLDRPELTAERFVPDPFSGDPGARLYRTGDLGRWLPGGTIRFLGRSDFQVKVRGFRIEPGEVEARLVEHPGVREAAVLAREDASGEKRLVAYHVGGAEPAEAAYVRLERLPLTPNGKLDREALPVPEGEAYTRRGYEAPLGETENALAEIWSELLGVERVGRWDHFFELGGHSLLAVQVVSRVRQVLRMEAAIGDLFARPVLADFARGLERLAAADLPAIEPADRTGPLALSFAQQRLWLLDRMGSAGTAYHVPMRMRLRGELDRPALEGALDRIVARHEALRTAFPATDGRPVQRVAPVEGSAFRLADHDLRGRADADAETELRRLVAGEARAPFDLERGPLVRGRLVRLAEDDHVLLLTMHHIVSDGWSSGVFLEELGVLYGAFLRGDADPLPPLPVQYADYAAWQRRWVDGEVLVRQAAYWKQALAGAPELLELPADHARPARQDHAGATVPVELDEALTARLKALGRRQGSTLFMTLLAGWAALLGRLSGQEDVVVGTPTANRGRREVEGLIGFFVNMLALRVELSGSPTVAELLGRVRARALEAQQNQDIPFEQVVELVQPTRSLAHGPLFQVVFAWQNAPRGSLSLPGLEPAPLPGVAPETAKFDLSLSLQEAGGRIGGGVTYATSLYEAATVERYLGYLRRVLEGLAADEHQPVERLALLEEAERAQVVEAWNRTEAEYARGVCVHELFEAQAERTPGAVALVHGERALTYGELDARADRLAHALAERGVGPEVRVALCVERGPEMVVGLLGVLKAGGAYVPLDPAYPAERLAFVLEDSAAAVVLTRESLREILPPTSAAVLCVERVAEAGGAAGPRRVRSRVRPTELAYVIYTSGSTGRPKGVMVEHGGVVALLHWLRAVTCDAERACVLGSTSISFDVSVAEIFGTLCWGGRLVLVENALALASLPEAAGVRLAYMVPGAAAELLQAGALPRGVRTLYLAGEALPAVLAQGLYAAGLERVVNIYGPTEDTVYATSAEVGRAAERIGIGRPISNTRAYVLDRAMEPAPTGVPGELYLGGAGVARGYLGRPELTAERFVPDAWSAEPGRRLYRTGDRARWLGGGELEYLGRMDQQVKVRGFRIEPGEIEARLREHAGVREAAVLAREDSPGERRLVAYYVGEAEAAALRSHLGERLPEHMVPAAYVRLERLPLTPSGKLDRAALPAPEGEAYARRGYEAPEGETEQALAEIWAEVLGVERVGRRDNFFELGGHSLLVHRLIQRMRRRGLHAEVSALFMTPTLAELAAVVGGESFEALVPPNGVPTPCEAVTPEMLPLVELSQAEIDAVVAGVTGGARNVQDIYPLAPLQEGMLFHHTMTTEGDPYLLASMSGFDRRERLDAYVGALQAVIDRHDILRTSVAWEGLREPVQVVWREARLVVEEVELDAAGGDAAKQLAARLDPPRDRIDVRRAPLMRVCAARDAARGRWLLLVQQHHLIGDHMTQEVLLEEVHAHLDGRAEELPVPLPFRNYVAQTRLGASRAGHEAYFRELLGSVEEPTVPFGLLDVWGDGSRIAEARLAVDGALAVRLRACARRLGVSAASVCHVAWAQVLARVSGREDVVCGTVLFGRMRGGEGSERVLGPFINTLPVRMQVGSQGVEASVRATHRQLAELLRHEQASLALAQRCSGVAAPAPLFTAVLSYRHSGGPGEARSPGAGGGHEGIRRIFDQERTNYPVAVYVDDRGEGFGLKAQVPRLVGPERVCAMLHRALEGLVEALEAAPDRAVGDVDVLPEPARREVVEAWNRTEAEYPRGLCVHELFEAQAGRTPEAVAVVHGDRALTYRELNARADRLAHALAERGVGPEVRVALCVERGPEMVVALLAVLKAGGAYVPLDPRYPEDRLRYMLRDSAPAVLLTQVPLAGRFAGTDVPLVELGADAPSEPGRQETDPVPGRTGPDHLAYVIYTSGSTGRPKGVMVRHEGLANYVWYARSKYADGGAVTCPLHSSLAFDLTVTSIFVPLVTGGSIVVAPEEGGDPSILRVFDEDRVDVVKLTPSHLALLAQRDLRNLRIGKLVVGGEDLKAPLARAISEASAGRLEIYNEYGPTEATVGCVVHAFDPLGDPDSSVPIGGPIANTQVYVLDGGGAPAPVGVVGELYVGGVGLARGYLDQAGLTAERFVPDPFGGVPGARLYRTGDLARWRDDGKLEFLGRSDSQVKVRGYRIEPGEIEARLADYPGVLEVVVLAREDTPGDRRLVAYFAAAEGEVEVEALRSHAGERLPEYMVPAAYVRLERLPLTPNGKVDRAALPASGEEVYGRRGYEAPVGETEQTLAEIWSELLGVQRVGRWDNFFELGGHSLLVLRLIPRMRRRGLRASGQALFMAPTLVAMAAAVGAERVDVAVPPNLIPDPAPDGPRPGSETVVVHL